MVCEARATSGRSPRLRPQIKTHKLVRFARAQVAAGAKGITCQKIGETEVMAGGGLDDILITYYILAPARLARLRALSDRRLLAGCGQGCGLSPGQRPSVGAGLGRRPGPGPAPPVGAGADDGGNRLQGHARRHPHGIRRRKAGHLFGHRSGTYLCRQSQQVSGNHGAGPHWLLSTRIPAGFSADEPV